MSDTRASRIGWRLRRFFTLLFVQPIRSGRLMNTGWSPGLQTIVMCGTAAFVLAIAIIVASPLLRAWLPLAVVDGALLLSLPRLLIPLFFSLVILSIALAQTAALHIDWRASVPITIVTCLLLLLMGGLDQGDSLIATALTPAKLVAASAAVALVVLLLVRRRREFAWPEFAVVLVLVGGTAVISLGRSAAHSAAFGLDFGPTMATTMMSSLGSLAVPAAVAAGVAVAELAIIGAIAVVGALGVRDTTAAVVSDGTTTPRSARVLLWAFVALAAWVAVENVVRYATGAPTAPTAEELGGTAVLVGLVVAGWIAIRLLERRRSRTAAGAPAALVPKELLTPEELTARMSDIVFPVAAALTALLGLVVVLLLTAQVIFEWAGDAEWATPLLALSALASTSAATTGLRVVVAILFIVLALVGARRGVRAVPELLFAFGVIILVTSLPARFGLNIDWSSEAISVLIATVTGVLAIVLATRRQLGSRQLGLLCVLFLLAEAVAWRDLIADPLSALLGTSAIAFILLGFVWAFVAGAELTRTGSPRYPMSARVLLFIANNLFGVTVLAFAAVARDLDAVIDLDKFADVGDVLLGTALIVIVAVTLWSTLVTGMTGQRMQEVLTSTDRLH